MKSERVPLMVRLPTEIHAQIKAAASKNDNSLNSEIVRRLRASLSGYKH